MRNPNDESASMLRAIAHPVRLELLQVLLSGEECVCHLTAVVGKRQAYVSQQLAALREAGLIAERKAGLRVYYHICDERASAVLKALGPTNGRVIVSRRHTVVRGCNCPKCGLE